MRSPRGVSAPRAEPECIVLAARPGATASPLPPVRIFLGSEPAQWRAERVFIWSVERVRDPRRRYEIYVMKDLAGRQNCVASTERHRGGSRTAVAGNRRLL